MVAAMLISNSLQKLRGTYFPFMGRFSTEVDASRVPKIPAENAELFREHKRFDEFGGCGCTKARKLAAAKQSRRGAATARRRPSIDRSDRKSGYGRGK
jgi:hypothetical protein